MGRIAAAVKASHEEAQKGPRGAKSRLPEPQVLRIMERHVTGESNREIARVEQIDRKTVARVLGSQEFQEHMRAQRERFYALAPAALDALQYALEQKKDARIAYEILADTGVIPSVEERTAALNQRPLSRSDQARETLVASLSRQDRILFDALRVFQAKAAGYGLPEESIFPDYQFGSKTPDSGSDEPTKVSDSLPGQGHLAKGSRDVEASVGGSR